MANIERQRNYVGMVVIVLMVVVSNVGCISTESPNTTSTTSPAVNVNSTSTTRRGAEMVNKTPSSSCILVAIDPLQEKIIHHMLDVQKFNLIQYLLVFPNHTVNPLTHNMRHVFKVRCLCYLTVIFFFF